GSSSGPRRCRPPDVPRDGGGVTAGSPAPAGVCRQLRALLAVAAAPRGRATPASRRTREAGPRRAVASVGPAAAAAAVVVALALLLGRGGSGQPAVTIGEKREQLARGTTLGQAASMFGLRPRAGNLLDVEGRLLRRGAVPGRLLLDGAAAPADA